MQSKLFRIFSIVIILSLSVNLLYAEKLKCKHKFMNEIWGRKVEVCYAKNYTNYTPKQSADEFLQDQIYVKGGRFNLNNNPKTHVKLPGFYIGKYLVPYQEYNAYLKATKQWNNGKVGNETSKDRLMFETLNGLYPATATYQNAEGFCQWMGKLTGLDVTLPQYVQWLYAATSRGTNWAYPTNNGKLEIGKNFPDYNPKIDKHIFQKITGLPINSLGIHQIFGNNWQWSRSILTNENALYFNVGGQPGYNIVGGTAYTDSAKQVKQNTLNSNFAKAVQGKGNAYGNLPFRCVINTEKPLPKSVPAS